MLAFGTPALFGQTSWDQPAFSGDPKEMLAAANAAPNSKGHEVTVLLDDRKFEFDEQNRATETYRLIYRVNTAEGVRDWGTAGTLWEPWHQQRPSVKARVIATDGSVYTLDPKNLTDSPVETSGQTFKETRRYHGPVPGIGIGAVVEQEVALSDASPYFAKGVSYRSYFSREVPTEKSRLTLAAPDSLPLHYSVNLLPGASVKRQVVAGKQQVTIEVGPLDAFKNEFGDLPTDVSNFPHVDLSTGRSWKDINDAYLASVEGTIHVEDVKNFISSLPAGANKNDIIKASVSKLHHEIRYTGVELGDAGLIPRSTAEILNRKFGDCKEKATLLVAMLRAQKIQSYVVLLRSAGAQDVAPDMPGMGQFDHAIVVVPGTPDLWIDATAEHTTVGTLPSRDQGRSALIIREGTSELVRTPEVASSANVSIERREFQLSDNGPAKVTETSLPSGELDSTLRRSFSGLLKEESRKELDTYMQNTYLAEKLTNVENGDGSDLLHPYELKLQSDKASRGSTDTQSAAVAIPVSQIWVRLPKTIRTAQDEDNNEKNAQAGKPLATRRTADFVLPEAFIQEWRYRIVPPDGFQVHGVPPNKVIPLGPAALSEEFSVQSDHVVTATLRFDTKRRRYTAEESRQMREALLKLQAAPMLLVSFDDTASLLLREGKPREALANSRTLAAKYPADALRRAKLARVLLDAGLGEAARVEAVAAVKLDPKSAYAQRSRGWILQQDLIGRRLERGYDREGSIEAYRKAKELDPNDFGIRVDLAIVLEYDAAGERYTTKSNLKEAIQELREMKTRFKDNHDYDDNLAFDLLYSGQPKELHEFVNEIGVNSETRRAMFVAAIAGESGPQAAIERASEVSSNDSDRAAALFLAGKMLLNQRRYQDAAALMQAGIAGQSNPEAAGLIEAVKKTSRFEDLPVPADPSSALVQKMLSDFMTGAPAERLLASESKVALDDGKTDKEHVEEIEKQSRRLAVNLRRNELPTIVLADIALSNSRYTSEQLDGGLVRVVAQAMGTEPQHFFTINENGQVKILGMSGKNMGEIGREAMILAGEGKLSAAKALLDYSREDVSKGGGEDDLAGLLFPRLYIKGQVASKTALEYAAAAILVDAKETNTKAIEILKRGADDPALAAKKVYFELGIAREYQKERKWEELKPYALSVLKASPQSETAFELVTAAFNGLEDWSGWGKTIQDRLESLPDDTAAIRSKARLEEAQSKFDKARAVLKPMIDSGRAGVNDRNQYLWDSLFIGTTADDLSIGQEALSHDKNEFPMMHTLACMLAAEGKYKEARELLTQAMNVSDMDEPESEVWFAYGLLAEQYGELQAARAAYARVEKPKLIEPTSTYSLTQMHLKALDAQAIRRGTGN